MSHGFATVENQQTVVISARWLCGLSGFWERQQLQRFNLTRQHVFFFSTKVSLGTFCLTSQLKGAPIRNPFLTFTLIQNLAAGACCTWVLHSYKPPGTNNAFHQELPTRLSQSCLWVTLTTLDNEKNTQPFGKSLCSNVIWLLKKKKSPFSSQWPVPNVVMVLGRWGYCVTSEGNTSRLSEIGEAWKWQACPPPLPLPTLPLTNILSQF